MNVNINSDLIDKIKKTLNIENVNDDLISQLINIGLNQFIDEESSPITLIIE
jgi:hypothetical protein